MTDLIEYMRMAVINTSGKEQEKCMRILRILERKKSAKNTVLKSITTIAVSVFLLSIMAMDSESNLPFYAGMISGLWLILFVIANKNTLKA